MQILRHSNGKLYIRGKLPNGLPFYRSARTKDTDEARRIGTSWENGEKIPGRSTFLPNSFGTPLSASQLPSVSSPSLPQSALTDSSPITPGKILLFPNLPIDDDIAVRDSLTLALGGTPSASAAEPAPNADGKGVALRPKRSNATMCEYLGAGIGTIMTGAIAWGMRQLDREPGKVSPSQLKELGEAISDQLKEWFNDVDLAPWHRICLLSLVITCGMWFQGKPIEKPKTGELKVA